MTTPRIIHRQRLRLRFGCSQLTVESETTVPVTAQTPASVRTAADLAHVFAARVPTMVPLLLQLGHKGLGRALTHLNGSGFANLGSPWAWQRLRSVRIGQRALVAAGFVLDAWQMAKAIRRSILARSPRPATAQAARSLTTWGAIWAGVELFGSGGALLGIELGPAVVVTTAIGATVGGCVGFFAGNWLGHFIESPLLRSGTNSTDT